MANANTRTLDRIRDVLPSVTDRFEKDKLLYIQGEISEAGMQARYERLEKEAKEYDGDVDPRDMDVKHLIEVAHEICLRYEKKRR